MLRPRLRWLPQAAVAAVLLAFLLRRADLEGVGERLGGVPPAAWALGLLLAASGLLLQAARWKLLLGNLPVTFRECYLFAGLGSALAMVAPSGLLADGAVGYWMGRRGGAVLRSLAALAVGRLLGGVSGLLLALAALPSHAWVLAELAPAWRPRDLPAAAVVLAAAAAIAAAALAALALRGRARPRRLAAWREALPSLRPGVVAAATVLSLGVHLCQMGVLFIGFRAVGAPVAYADVMFFAPLITLLGTAPVSLGGIGVREGLGIFFYTLLPGVDPDAVLAQAGYGYLVLFTLASLNLALAAALLGPARRRRPAGAPGSGTPGVGRSAPGRFATFGIRWSRGGPRKPAARDPGDPAPDKGDP